MKQITFVLLLTVMACEPDDHKLQRLQADLLTSQLLLQRDSTIYINEPRGHVRDSLFLIFDARRRERDLAERALNRFMH